jgi:hypothetical protein
MTMDTDERPDQAPNRKLNPLQQIWRWMIGESDHDADLGRAARRPSSVELTCQCMQDLYAQLKQLKTLRETQEISDSDYELRKVHILRGMFGP